MTIVTDPYVDEYNPEKIFITVAEHVALEDDMEAVVAIDIDLDGLYFNELIKKDLDDNDYEKWFLATKNHKVASHSHNDVAELHYTNLLSTEEFLIGTESENFNHFR